MVKYKYTASKNGKTVTGAIEASSEETAAKTLLAQGVHPLVIKAEKSGPSFNFLNRKKSVKLKDLVIFSRQLSTMVSAGVPLTKSLAALQSQTDNKFFGSVIGEVSKDIEGGKSLTEALARHPNVFSEVYVNMVRAGETGGILDEILKRLAAQVEKEASIRKKIKSAMAYPLVILSITIIAFFGIMIFIIPKLAAILKDMGGENAQLPVYTQILLDTSEFMQANFVFILLAGAVAIFAIRKYIKTPSGKYRFHQLLLRLPIFKTIVTKIAIARFSRTFASLMSSGVSMLDALEVTGASIGNKVIEKEIKAAAKEVKNGKQLSEPLSQSKHFPPIVAEMLAIGEESGQVDTILLKVADFYEEEVDAVIDSVSSLIEPIMIIILGSFVGLIAASVMGPIASLSQNVGDG